VHGDEISFASEGPRSSSPASPMPTGSVAGVVALTIHSSLDERRVATGTYCSLGGRATSGW
jgi:hypothetical protein